MVLIMTAAIAATCSSAIADPDYSAQDIINHFARQTVPANAGNTGPAAISIPRTGDYKSVASEPAATAGYDLLVTFELGSANLTERARQNLAQFASALSTPELSGSRFLVEGHTDASGSAAFNQHLSENRAAAVVLYLNQLGIARERLLARGHGESMPMVADPFAATNRRVETRMLR